MDCKIYIDVVTAPWGFAAISLSAAARGSSECSTLCSSTRRGGKDTHTNKHTRQRSRQAESTLGREYTRERTYAPQVFGGDVRSSQLRGCKVSRGFLLLVRASGCDWCSRGRLLWLGSLRCTRILLQSSLRAIRTAESLGGIAPLCHADAIAAAQCQTRVRREKLLRRW